MATKSFKSCIDKMKKAAKGIKLSDKQAADILNALAEERKSQKANGLENPDDLFLQRVEEIVNAEITAATIEKRNAAINRIRKREFLDYAANFDDDYDALQAFLAGINKPIEGARASVAARQQSLFNEYLKGLLTKLERDNLLPHFNDAKNGRDIAIELYELDIPNGNPGRTNNTPAVQIAKVIKSIQDDLVARQNKYGAWIKKLPGYITKQSHDMEKVRKVTFEEWRDYILPRLDLETTFKSIPQEKWGESLFESYKGITSGLHGTAHGATEADGLVAFRGPGSIGRRVSESRTMHFKSAESWVEYNERFGVGTVQGSIVRAIDRTTRNLALMEKMGPNPRNFFDTIKSELLERNKTNTKVFDKLNSSKGQFVGDTPENVFKELTGESHIAKNLTGARIAQGVRQWTNMVSLGGSVFSQIPDIAIKASELRYQGRHPLEGYRQAILDIFAGKGDKEKQIIAHSLGAGFEGTLHETVGRFMVDDQLPGNLTNITNMFFKLNLMTYWNESQKMGMVRSMSAFLAKQSDSPFNRLDQRTREIFSLYQIGETEWDSIRLAKTKVGDYEYLLPELINDEVIRSRFQDYLADRVDIGVLTPGVRERAIINRGTNPGTFEGEMLRFIGQFKTFSISILTKVLPREVQGFGSNSSKVLGIAQLMIAGTVLGYMAMSMKDIAKGLEPRPLDDPRTWKAAMLQGGGLGIYGDFLFGEYDRYGASFTSTLAGPTVSRLDPVAKTFAKAMKGLLDKEPGLGVKGSDVFQLVKNNTPFLNLFYLRAALDYLFLYDIQENLNPGFLRRMESRIMDEQGHKFIVPPSSV